MASDLRISVPALGLITLLAGCEAPVPRTPGKAPDPQVTTAYFTENPANLIAAARKACKRPGEEFVQPRAGVVQCRVLLNPPTTAAVILNYDGDINALPQLVISLTTSKAGKGHLVTGCAFLKVPRKDGRISRIVQNDRAVDAKLRQMLRAVGGKPVRAVTREAAERCFAL